MPIPQFDGITNVLPPHVGNPAQPADMSPYPSTIVEVCERFSTSQERIVILGGLVSLREELLGLGVSGFQWLDGSFLEDIEAQEGRPPRDIDVVTFVETPDNSADLQTVFYANTNIFSNRHVKPTYHVDHFLVPLCSSPRRVVELTRYWYGLFSHRRDGIWKGMLNIPLQNSDDHTAARSKLQATP